MNKKNILLIIVVFLIFCWYANIKLYKNEIELTQLSAKGDDGMMGYFIKTKNNKIIVVDGGLKTETEDLINYIKDNGNKVDYWFITHPHKDHVGAFIDIVQNTDIEIKQVYYSANSMEWYNTYASSRAYEMQEFYNALENKKIKNIARSAEIKETIELDKNIKAHILGVNNPEITENAINNSSMVFKIEINDKTILFLGDTGKESSQKLISQYGEKMKSDIVQVAHHGNNGATEELYKLIKPEICLWPTPLWLWNNDSGNGYNSGNWTTLETRKWIKDLGVTQNYVAKDGQITIKVK